MCIRAEPGMEGSVGVRVGARTRVGYQVLAHRLGHQRVSCQDCRSWQGRFMQGSLDLKGLVGLGRRLNSDGHGAFEVHNALKLLLSSCSLGLCKQMFDLIAFLLSLYVSYGPAPLLGEELVKASWL